jgi:hypothetical protein
LVTLIFGMGVKAEAADHIEPGPGYVLGARRPAPIIEPFDIDVLIAKAPGVLREQLEHATLLGELAAQAAMQGDVARDLVVQHDASPGQGWATFISIGTSTLA